MTIILNILISIILPLILGYLILSSLCIYQLPTAFKVSIGFGLGLGILTLWMLCLDIFGITFSRAAISMPLLFISCVLFYYTSKRKKVKLKLPQVLKNNTVFVQELGLLQFIIVLILLIYIFLNVFYVYWRALTFPVYCWDEISTIAFKAKIFFYERSIPDLNLLPHQSYPLLVPLVESWIAFNLGHWNDVFIKLFFPLIFSAYIIIHYYFILLYTNQKWAIWGVALLLSSNFFIFHATIAYRDFILMYYTCSTIMLLLLWFRTKCASFLFIASLFAGFSTFTKLEGTAYLLIFLIILLIILFKDRVSRLNDKLRYFLIFSIPSFTIAISFHIYKILHNAMKDGQGHIDKTHFEVSFDKIKLIPQVLSSYIEDLFFSGNWNILWGALIISLILSIKKRQSFETHLILFSLILFFGLYACTAIFSSNFIWIAGELNITTLSRLILHFFPLAVILIIFINYSLMNDSD